jgi:hypothetical protein
MYSSLARPEDLATRFSAAFDERSVPTDEVQDLARQITRGLEAPRDKAQAVHEWIRRNLRYVAIFVGVGGWEPNDTATILRRRWGDCKDHVLLMQALLRAVGVEARPALVRIGDEHDLPPLAVAWFNHVILHLPGLGLYADPTARTIPFGDLPWSVMDKPVLVSAAGGPQVLRTPRLDPGSNRLHVKSAWRIDASGAAARQPVQSHHRARGVRVALRSGLPDLRPAPAGGDRPGRRTALRERLRAAGPGAQRLARVAPCPAAARVRPRGPRAAPARVRADRAPPARDGGLRAALTARHPRRVAAVPALSRIPGGHIDPSARCVFKPRSARAALHFSRDAVD